ncbi:MAG: phosphoribosylamine--glycine ligase [Coriobacteriia bacterium]|nr:phosphoribosylamine--glycine ligase [Coriobacteriia bacterium]
MVTQKTLKLTILVIGSGGREHAIVRGLDYFDEAARLYVAPGNGGTLLEPRTENVALTVTDHDAVVAFCQAHDIGLVVVGPEAPLVDGLADSLRAAGIPVFGPGAASARLEGSKAFAKAFMRRHDLPTAAYEEFTAEDAAAAYEFIEARAGRVVVKADGLAAGKGVVVAQSVEEARAAARASFEGAFGASGARVVIEERLEGPECSLLALVDGATMLALPLSQDHKRAHDGDAGPNTGGMGAYSPVPMITARQEAQMTEVMARAVAALVEDGIDYHGVLYGGFMLTEAGPQLLEFNVRFGDPETQVVLPRIRSNLVQLMYATATGTLAQQPALEIDERAAVGVVIASAGYPGSVQTGKPISGLGRAQVLPGVEVYHAATTVSTNEAGVEQVVTTGGRVACVTALADSFEDAREHAYEAARHITFEGSWSRSDIGLRALSQKGE